MKWEYWVKTGSSSTNYSLLPGFMWILRLPSPRLLLCLSCLMVIRRERCKLLLRAVSTNSQISLIPPPSSSLFPAQVSPSLCLIPRFILQGKTASAVLGAIVIYINHTCVCVCARAGDIGELPPALMRKRFLFSLREKGKIAR